MHAFVWCMESEGCSLGSTKQKDCSNDCLAAQIGDKMYKALKDSDILHVSLNQYCTIVSLYELKFQILHIINKAGKLANLTLVIGVLIFPYCNIKAQRKSTLTVLSFVKEFHDNLVMR